MKPKKCAWSMGRKDTYTTSKKESWKNLKEFQEKKKKQKGSSDSKASKRGVVHVIGFAIVMGDTSWVSVASSEIDDEKLLSLGRTSLTKREC